MSEVETETSMDLKGISWVGNFYEKFEAMCLEVEEVMYQDTVKYVENQVQTVGSSVKKFYSEVMQDLLPPSSIEKNTKSDDIKKVSEDQNKTNNCNLKNAPTPQRVGHVDNLFPLSQEDFSRENSKENPSKKSSLRTRKGSVRENLSENEKSRCVFNVDEDMKITLSDENHRGTRIDVQKLNGVSRSDTLFDEHNSFHMDTKITAPRFSEEIENDFVEKSGNEAEIVSEKIGDLVKLDEEHGIGEEMDGRASSGNASLVESNAVNVFTNDGAISLAESCSNWQEHSNEISSGEDFLFSSDSSNGWNCTVNEVDASFVSEMEVVQQPNDTKLEESCILVNRDDFRFVPCHLGKSKSYQKKIRDVFSPRKSSTRKQEYEQLAMWPAVNDSSLKKEEFTRNSIPSLAIKDGKRSSSADEGDWELL